MRHPPRPYLRRRPPRQPPDRVFVQHRARKRRHCWPFGVSAALTAARSAASLAAPGLPRSTARSLVSASGGGGGEPDRHRSRCGGCRSALPGPFTAFWSLLRCRCGRPGGGCGQADDAGVGHYFRAGGADFGEVPHACDGRVVPQNQYGAAGTVNARAFVGRATLCPALAGGPLPHPGCFGVGGGVQGGEAAQSGDVPRPRWHGAGARGAGDSGCPVGVAGQPHRPGTARCTPGGEFGRGSAHMQPSVQGGQGRHIMTSPPGDRQHLAGADDPGPAWWRADPGGLPVVWPHRRHATGSAGLGKLMVSSQLRYEKTATVYRVGLLIAGIFLWSAR